jgi:hypothetical protein
MHLLLGSGLGHVEFGLTLLIFLVFYITMVILSVFFRSQEARSAPLEFAVLALIFVPLSPEVKGTLRSWPGRKAVGDTRWIQVSQSYGI